MPCLFIIMLTITPSVFQAQTVQTTLFVDDDNIQGPWDGSLDHPYNHIQDAIDNAAPYDRIYIFNGLYQEPIEINKPLFLEGQEKNTTMLSGSDNTTIISIHSNEVTLTQMTITHGFIGVSIINSDTIQIQKTNINNHYIGTEIQGSSNIQISQNNIMDIEVYAIHITMSVEQESNYITISENTIQHTEHGLFLADGQGHHIHDNIVQDNKVGFGLFMTTGETTLIENNMIMDNNDGILLYSPSLKSPINIQQNTIINNQETGICGFIDPLSSLPLTDTNAVVQHNNIYQNGRQAYLYLTVNGLSDFWNIFSGRKTLFHANYWGTTTSPYPIPAEIAVFIGIVPQLIYQGTLTWGKDTAPATKPYY